MTKIKDIKPLVDRERIQAQIKYGATYNSPAEAWAILEEEWEETKEQLDITKNFIDEMWSAIRQDRFEDIYMIAKRANVNAQLMIAEAIQVSAVCEKIMGVTDGL